MLSHLLLARCMPGGLRRVVQSWVSGLGTNKRTFEGPTPGLQPGPRVRAYLTKADRKRLLFSAKPLGPRALKGAGAIGVDSSSSPTPRRTEAKPFATPSSDSPPTATPAATTSSAPADQGHVLWYRDPYHLSRQVRKLVDEDRIPEALELVGRHTGAGNAAVYGTLLSALKGRGEHALVFQTYCKLRQRRLLNAKMYTTVLDSLAALAAAPTNILADRAKLLEDAQRVLAHLEASPMEVPTLIHYNVMLKVCKTCADAGGWEVAQTLYARMPERDSITYTLMLQLTARSGAPLDWPTVIRLYEDLQVDGVPMEGHILVPLLQSCIRHRDEMALEFGQELLQRYLDFPHPAVAQAGSTGRSPLPMDLPLLLRCVRLLYLSPTPLLAYRFAMLHLDTPGLSTGTSDVSPRVWEILLSVLIREREWERAWELVVQHMPEALQCEASTRMAAAVLWPKEASKSQLYRGQEETLGEGQRSLWLARAATYDHCQPARTTVAHLTNSLKVAMADASRNLGELCASTVQHHLPLLKGVERRITSRAQRALPSSQPKRLELELDLRLLGILEKLLRKASGRSAVPLSTTTFPAKGDKDKQQQRVEEAVRLLRSLLDRVHDIRKSITASLILTLHEQAVDASRAA